MSEDESEITSNSEKGDADQSSTNHWDRICSVDVMSEQKSIEHEQDHEHDIEEDEEDAADNQHVDDDNDDDDGVSHLHTTCT